MLWCKSPQPLTPNPHAVVQESDTGAALLNSAAVLDPVPVNERITVFAPTNEAFNGAEAAFGGELPPDAVPDVRPPPPVLC